MNSDDLKSIATDVVREGNKLSTPEVHEYTAAALYNVAAAIYVLAAAILEKGEE